MLTVTDLIVMCLSAAALGAMLALVLAWLWATGDHRKRRRKKWGVL